jgi:hypothetical protein
LKPFRRCNLPKKRDILSDDASETTNSIQGSSRHKKPCLLNRVLTDISSVTDPSIDNPDKSNTTVNGFIFVDNSREPNLLSDSDHSSTSDNTRATTTI